VNISDFSNGKNKKNFELLPAEEFKARVTQHIPEKGFQMMRSSRWHSKQIHGAAAEGGDAETWGYAARKRGQREFHHTGRIQLRAFACAVRNLEGVYQKGLGG